jgi:hypothetical protein
LSKRNGITTKKLIAMLAITVLVAIAVSVGLSTLLAAGQDKPAYDSGWVDITGKMGRNITFTQSLNSLDVSVEILGRTTVGGGVHQRNLGKVFSGLEQDVWRDKR